MNPHTPKRRQCSGKNKAGKPCGRPPIRGGFVCPLHGGGLPRVRAKANERLADLIDPDRALRTAAALAYSDLGLIYDDNWKLKPLREWPLELRQAVKSIAPRTFNENSGDGMQDHVLQLALWDKPKALEMLFDHLGLKKAQQIDARITYGWKMPE